MIAALPIIIAAVISLLQAAGLTVLFVKLWGNGALDQAARGVGAAAQGVGTGLGQTGTAVGSAANATGKGLDIASNSPLLLGAGLVAAVLLFGRR